MENNITLIGKQIEVAQSKNKKIIGKKGKIKMETKNTITLDNGLKLIKSHLVFRINEKLYSGKSEIGTPENKIKKLWSKK